MNNEINLKAILSHALGNLMGSEHSSFKAFKGYGIIPRYISWDLDEEGWLWWWLFGDKKSTNNPITQEQLRKLIDVLAKLIPHKSESIEIDIVPLDFNVILENIDNPNLIWNVPTSSMLIVLEALTNAIKHGDSIWVSDPTEIGFIQISNSFADGKKDIPKSSGFGLKVFKDLIITKRTEDRFISYVMLI